ncbi:B-box zinc finger protein 21-like [Rhododendron vialii]|uniref:B-box zinc finger protein 21-like n=1 Tax=Rhododendron vialii TaxID=182163 RepID=UPI00265F368A|nr:B-box zinc finger protein 21-like [Rhododendron vialii]
MKIQCDVCTKDEASVFCTADEAALCDGCDHRVHHANKLAGKHHRFSLLHPPSPTHFPLCDICKEKRAFLFCQQDRAILCRDCDFPIHKANEHTQNHNRFLLTGVKLSATATVYSSATASDSVPDVKSQKGAQISIEKPISVKPAIIHNSLSVAATVKTTAVGTNISSISEYLIETIPGWRVEDLLDSPPPSSFGLSEAVGDVLPIWDVDLESNHLRCSFSSPEALPTLPIFPTHQCPSSNISFGGQISFKESKEVVTNRIKSSRKWRDDGCFIVPQISSPSNPSSKRSRTFW